MKTENKGKFIVFYGVNNLGKSTQAKLLAERLVKIGRDAKYIKYPIYDLEPSGPMITEYLRSGNPYNLSPREIQIIYAENRFQYEPSLRSILESGIDVVAEDYWGTGIAWGVGAGVDKEFLLRQNKTMLSEDVAFLLFGKRFTQAIESGHTHENNEALISRVGDVHLELAKQFGWKIINANRTIDVISEEVWKTMEKIIG